MRKLVLACGQVICAAKVLFKPANQFTSAAISRCPGI
ncbi:hypothetical protein NK6_4258 [Bradyrhizobium diazoefficiens]|uniref:Uncharacterized protein n=1 Tax=Bradyrhizobium diazoefficiens TaxID=1355477 RepID=A0A0E4BQH6_9BRAD|nr:hypothetical protein NK6_4258 [Bradyrhizobium diazoefficiens]